MISLRKLLFGDADIPFVSVSLAPDGMKEKVQLKARSDGILHDISKQQSVVCQDPFMIAIWRKEPFPKALNDVSFMVLYKNKLVGKTELTYVHNVPFQEGNVMLMKSTRASSYHLNWVMRTAMLLYLRFRWKKQQANITNFCVAYSYPRKVVLVSFLSGDHFNIFPMDFHGYIPECNGYLLGLRTTNYTMAKILEKRRILVCEVPASQKDIIYQLGKHHGKNPPSTESLPFSVYQSKEFKFYYPEFTMAYYEIELTHNELLGSHMLLAGQVINHVKIQEAETQLHHIHTLHYLHTKK